ncbi:hypothetical protein, partial [Halospina sp. K52047b]|uniref:hypothetical protein n=1 Tax=Halospina sp. K52047b TaxID=2614160 RepID=UPI001CE3E43E
NTQYKEYKTVALEDVSLEINAVKSGECHQEKENCIYVPVIGTSRVVSEKIGLTIKEHNVFQIVLCSDVDAEYLSVFFQSD